MTEEPTKPTEAGASGPVAGERLGAARQARHISLVEIARELHLDEAKVQALEQNAFEFLGAPVFVKGYLRKYATLVEQSGDDVVADYERLNHSVSAPPIVGFRTRPPRDVSPGPWLAGIAVLAVAALGTWWYMSSDGESLGSGASPGELHSPAADTPAPLTSVETPAQPVPEAEEPGIETAPAAEEADVASPPPAAPAEEPAATTSPQAAAGEIELRLTFSGDCWTEVTDANGGRLYFGLGAAGRSVAVAGAPPLQVLLGDSDNVRVEVDGAQYTIPRSARRGDTARFTISP